MRKIVALLLLLVGISMLRDLWPMPNQLSNEYHNKAVTKLTVPAPAESSIEFKQSPTLVNDTNLYLKSWAKWFKSLAIIVSCIFAGWLMLMQTRFWAVSVLISTGFYTSSYGLFLLVIFDQDNNFSRVFSLLAPDPLLLFNLMLTKDPLLLLGLIWYFLIIPLVFIIGAYMAIKSIMTQRKTALTLHSTETSNGVF